MYSALITALTAINLQS